MVNEWMDELGMKWMEAVVGYFSIFPKGLRKNSFSIACLRVEIETQNSPNAKQRCYQFDYDVRHNIVHC
jgi:hypothetical protein